MHPVVETTVVDEGPVAPDASGKIRRRWVILVLAVVVVAAAAITTTVWVRHYSAAPALRNDGGEYGWVDGTGRNASVGGFEIFEAQARPRHTQSFVFWVHNPSSVTQTILGLAPGGETAEPSHVLVSTVDPDRPGSAETPFRATPVAVPPHQYRAIRYVLRSLYCWSPGRSETFLDVTLRVRVGAFTRDEDVSFGGQRGFVLSAAHRIC